MPHVLKNPSDIEITNEEVQTEEHIPSLPKQEQERERDRLEEQV